MPAGNILAILTKEGRVINAEEHTHCRLIYCNWRKRFGMLIICNGIAYLKALYAHNCADISTLHLICFNLAQAVKDHKVLNLGFLHRTVSLAEGYLLTCVKGSSLYPANCNSAHIRGVLQGGDKHLASALLNSRRRNDIYYGIQQRCYICGWLLPIQRHPALLGAAIDSSVVQLVLCGIKGEHKVEDLLVNLVGTTILLIYLIYYHNRLLAKLYSLLQHKSGLWHCSLKGIYKQQHSVCHI